MCRDKAFYESKFGPVKSVTERPVDICKSMIGIANGLWRDHISILKGFFDDQEFRVFCILHSRFGTGVANSRYHSPDAFEKAVGEWLMPRPGDKDLISPEVPEEVEKVLKMFAKYDPEVMPRCIFIPGTVVTFDINRRSEWNGYGDVAVADGLIQEWPDTDDKLVIHDVIQYLKDQPIVAV